MLKTRITELFGIDHPIIGGGMGSGVASPRLVAAAAEAGILPILGTATDPIATIRDNIARVRDLTDKRFGVNLLLIPGSYPDASAVEVAELIAESGVAVVETAGRNPASVVPLLKSSGARVLHKAARVRDALSAERAGVDAVAVLAYEAAGHVSAQYIGQLVQLQLGVAQLAVPVIAAGGFASGSSVLAALALGAEGVLIGTRLMLTEESPLHAATKQALLAAAVTDTVILAAGSGDDVRVYGSPRARELSEEERREGLDYPSLKERMRAGKDAALFHGEAEQGTFPLGQAVGLIDRIEPVATVVARIVSELEQARARLNGRFAAQSEELAHA